MNSQLACLLRVDRRRLGEYLDGLEIRRGRRLQILRRGLRDQACLLKSPYRHLGFTRSAISATISAPGYPAAKTSAGDYSLNPMTSAGPVSRTGALRKPKGSQLRHVAGIFILRLARKSLRTPKPSRLHLFRSTLCGDRFRRTAKKTSVHGDLLFHMGAGLGWGTGGCGNLVCGAEPKKSWAEF